MCISQLWLVGGGLQRCESDAIPGGFRGQEPAIRATGGHGELCILYTYIYIYINKYKTPLWREEEKKYETIYISPQAAYIMRCTVAGYKICIRGTTEYEKNKKYPREEEGRKLLNSRHGPEH